MDLADYQVSWGRKPVLRQIYQDLYEKISRECVDGDILEIGGGIGNFSPDAHEIVRSDIQAAESVDFAADAHHLPVADQSFSNIVLFDVLHHLECPMIFLAEAQRVLKPGGRLIMMEPYISPVSWFFYHFFHEEDVDLSWRPQDGCKPAIGKDPYQSNQAIPSLLFGRRNLFRSDQNLGLRLISKTVLSIFVYPLSGGFKKWSLVPSQVVKPLLRLDDLLARFLGNLFGFRVLVVLEK